MRINHLEELRKIQQEIRNCDERDCVADIKKKEEKVLAAVKEIIKLSRIARKEGLLALEEAVEDIPLYSEREFLKQLIILITDGTEPKIIQGIGMARYCAGLYTDYEALVCMIYLEGALSIQAGDNPRILEEKLKAMLPVDMYFNYSAFQEKEELEKQKIKEKNRIDGLCKGELSWNPKERNYYILKLADYVLCNMKDKDLQRMMRSVDNVDLSLAMKGMSGKARRHIFDNLSERLGAMIAEDMTYMGPVRMTDVLETVQKILNILIKLIEDGEIVGRYEYLEPFYNAFQVDAKFEKQKDDSFTELKKIMEEYEQDGLCDV